jgi:cell division septation protein DedD
MTLPNIRRNATEAHHYDPKQRLVGGIVLVLIMLLIYSILKLLLGYAPSAGKYSLHDPLPDEITAEEVRIANNNRTMAAIVPPTSSTPPAANNPAAQVTSRAAPVEKSNVLLPVGFVFLDINGKPMQHEVNPLPDSVPSTPAKSETPVEEAPPSDGKKWAIQVASFNDDKRAQAFVQKLKDKEISAEVLKSGKQYSVRLTPVLDSRKAAELALQKVREQMRDQINIKGLILQAGQ